MSFPKFMESSDNRILDELKEISGRRIEDERRRRRMTQRQFAPKANISIRWLREIEAGNPVVKFDDHLRCASALQMAPTYIFIPLLYRSYGRQLPINFSVADLADIERRCLAMIGRRMAELRS
ncbi:helix-turn-helix domain-containing protein [Sphingopyxis sp.]|jgi:transcriptional regulator with XRE-family HTH domain|uniref:helix-turn-helix domain-containing protein n=1 Tax=Sphingopyxis sp. TaxID=1908224 RepID=UPI002DF81403|nr:helix-turn-helix domain-containing protein [Sphingopyxis sp.]